MSGPKVVSINDRRDRELDEYRAALVAAVESIAKAIREAEEPPASIAVVVVAPDGTPDLVSIGTPTVLIGALHIAASRIALDVITDADTGEDD